MLMSLDFLCFCSSASNLFKTGRESEADLQTSLIKATSPRVPPGMIMRQRSFSRETRSSMNKQDEEVLLRKLRSVVPSSVISEKVSTTSSKTSSQATVVPSRGAKRSADAAFSSTGESQQYVLAQNIAMLVQSLSGNNEAMLMIPSSKTPLLSFEKYVDRLIRFFNKWAEEADGPDSIGVSCAVAAVIYLKRIGLKSDSNTIYRCFLAAYLVGVKLIYDFYMSNNYWASVGGITPKEMNELESVFCNSLGWQFSISPDELDSERQCVVQGKPAIIVAY